MNKLYIAALLQLALTCSPAYTSNNATQSSPASDSMPQATDVSTEGVASSDTPAPVAIEMKPIAQKPSAKQSLIMNPEDRLTPEKFAADQKRLEQSVEKMIATYPAVYRVRPNQFNVKTITATNPDNNEAITGITSILFHKKFNPAQAFSSSKSFDQTCAVQWKTGSTVTNGYVVGVDKQSNEGWALMLMALTPKHPINETFNTKVVIPNPNQQITLTVTPKTTDEIRTEIRKQLGLNETVQPIKGTINSRR